MAGGPRRRASSPIRRTVLSGIPEASPPPPDSTSGRRIVTPAAVTPGPNAFALRAAEVNAHRLRGNAFYQQATAAEDARRQDEETASRLGLTAPTASHPAFRENFRLGDTSPRSNLMANQMAVTKAESLPLKPDQTPPLQLIPKEGFQGHPTERSLIEGFHEELEPKDSSNETGRAQVFKHTPKLRSSEFSESSGPTTPQKKKGGVFNLLANEDQPGSPKKGIFEKFRRTAARTPQAPNPTSSYSIARGDGGGEALPPKAKAVLSTIPQKNTLGRSPSKKLGQLARKASDAVFLSEMTKARRSLGNELQATSAQRVNFSASVGTNTRNANFSASVGSRTPARELRPKVKRIASQPQPQLQTEQDEGKLADHADITGVLRAQSLQYFDRQNPPTPPAKNTPPHEKKLKAEQEEVDRLLAAIKERSEHQAEILNKMTQRKPVVTATPTREMQQKAESKLTSPLHHRVFEDDTPTRETFKLIGADGRTSPTKFGTYAHKNLPTIVKAPSIHSMYGACYPDLREEHSHEEVKKRVDGLGLDGLREIPENYYKGNFNVTHSPTIREDDWSINANTSNQASADTLHSTGMFQPSPSVPDVLEHVRQLSSPALPASAAQARQLSSKIPMPFKVSPSITARTSSRTSSKGTIPLFYPGLASDPSRMNLLEDLDNHRGSAPGTRPRLHNHFRMDVDDDHPDSLMNVSDESDMDLPQLSPDDAYSHPSARPSPLRSPSSPEFSPVAHSTPPRKGDNGALSASPSPHKTLTPSRNRGRIETFISNGSPVARGADGFPVESKTQQLPPPQLKALTPAVSATPHAGSPAFFLDTPEKTELVVYPAEKPLILLEGLATSTSAVQSDPQKVDNARRLPAPVPNTLVRDLDVHDFQSSLAKYRQPTSDDDDRSTEPIKLPSSISNNASVGEPSGLDPATKKPQTSTSRVSSGGQGEAESWHRVADQYQAQINTLKAELATIKAEKTLQGQLAALKAGCNKQQQPTTSSSSSAAPTSASANADTIRKHLASGEDTELWSSGPGGLRALGLYAKHQQTRIDVAPRQSEKDLLRRFDYSSANQQLDKANREFLGESESKEASLAQVLAAIGGLSQRVEAMEKDKKTGE